MDIKNQEKVDLDSLTAGTETIIHCPYSTMKKGEYRYLIQKFDKKKDTWVDLNEILCTKEQADKIISELCSECTDDDKVKITSLI